MQPGSPNDDVDHPSGDPREPDAGHDPETPGAPVGSPAEAQVEHPREDRAAAGDPADVAPAATGGPDEVTDRPEATPDGVGPDGAEAVPEADAVPEPEPEAESEPVPEADAEWSAEGSVVPEADGAAPGVDGAAPAADVPDPAAPAARTGETAEIDAAGRTAAVPLDEASRAAGHEPADPAAPDHAPAEHDPADPGAVDPAATDPDAPDGRDPSETPALLAGAQGHAQRVRRWWRRAGSGVVQRWVLSLVIASLVIVVGLLVADRWALMRARGEAEQAFETFTEEITGHEVRLDGFPFLPQVISGRIDRVDFTAEEMVLPDVELIDVTGWATGIGFREPVELAHLEASGTVPLAAVQEEVAAATFDVPVLGERSFEADIVGSDLVLTTSILGGDIEVTAEVTPTEDGRGIHIHLDQGTLGGVSTRLSEIPLVGSRLPLDHEVSLDTLPENVVLTATTVVDDGIRVSIEGDDVRF